MILFRKSTHIRKETAMDLRVLEYFLAVADEENISHAAELLHVSQPTISRQLMDLEEELGQKTVYPHK